MGKYAAWHQRICLQTAAAWRVSLAVSLVESAWHSRIGCQTNRQMGDVKAKRPNEVNWVNYVWISLKIGPKSSEVFMTYAKMAKVHRASFATRSSPGGKFEGNPGNLEFLGRIHALGSQFPPSDPWQEQYIECDRLLKKCHRLIQ